MGLQIPSNRVQLPTYPLDLYFLVFLGHESKQMDTIVSCLSLSLGWCCYYANIAI